ncbi:pyridoxamine 5'-phosphate oxidase family protein [Paenibacillus sp. P26]|nr:pyridoxamine 5'-phosphate oxidase family protein [Paenibacillus sp. P26]UUZ92132.1 pyridoxamine 5'-phosphate oxidase family protein [Paenibacillus sp. P25]
MSIFENVISSEDELRSLLGFPSELVQNKVISHLDQHCLEFISKSPFLVMATSDNQGMCDVSPRGDAPGFVEVLDETHILIPERPGNRKLDSLRNILSNPKVGLVFIIPGLEETLRINGNACIIRDEDLLERMEVNGKIPVVGIGVAVEECFVHCAKAFKRSNLWNPQMWLHEEGLPNIAKMIADHVKLPGIDAEKVDKALQDSYLNRLY